MNLKKASPLIGLLILAIITLIIRQYNNSPAPVNDQKVSVSKRTNGGTINQRGLNRNPSYINYSKHARCRMQCRHIDEKEIAEILKHGKINYTKSELKGTDCNKKYAVEGFSHDNQHLRIIFAPCQDELTVVTVIDLGKEWPCECN